MKPYSLRTEYHIQSTLVVANVIVALSAIFLGAGVIGFLALLQFCGGCVQMIDSGVNLSVCHPNNPFYEWRLKHYWGSLIYIAIIVILPFIDFGTSDKYIYIYFFMLFAIPQIIFYTYYIMTIREMHYWERKYEELGKEETNT